MSAIWSAEQQRCLAALGYTVYRPAVLPASDAVSATLVGAAPGTQAPAMIDPLLRALLRAANRDRAQIDTDAWIVEQNIPSLPQLRNDAIAKRALWPQLRALRRENGKP